jgi:hypothetical protein
LVNLADPHAGGIPAAAVMNGRGDPIPCVWVEGYDWGAKGAIGKSHAEFHWHAAGQLHDEVVHAMFLPKAFLSAEHRGSAALAEP